MKNQWLSSCKDCDDFEFDDRTCNAITICLVPRHRTEIPLISVSFFNEFNYYDDEGVEYEHNDLIWENTCNLGCIVTFDESEM